MTIFSFDPSDLDELEGLLENLFDMSSDVWAVILAIIIVAGILVTLVGIVTYLIHALGLYRMAKNVGYRKAWLAWIPYASSWLQFNLPTKEYKVLAVNKVISSRNIAFWIYIAISVGGMYVASIFSVIPYIGALIGGLLRIAVMVAIVFFVYPMYKDLFALYYEESSAKGYAVASVIGTFLAPILPAILMMITSSKAPREYIVDDASETVMQE